MMYVHSVIFYIPGACIVILVYVATGAPIVRRLYFFIHGMVTSVVQVITLLTFVTLAANSAAFMSYPKSCTAQRSRRSYGRRWPPAFPHRFRIGSFVKLMGVEVETEETPGNLQVEVRRA